MLADYKKLVLELCISEGVSLIDRASQRKVTLASREITAVTCRWGGRDHLITITTAAGASYSAEARDIQLIGS